MTKHSGRKITSLFIAVMILLSCLTAVSYAVTDQDLAQIIPLRTR